MIETKYFDNAATTFCYPEVLKEVMDNAIAYPANPSATHREGREAKAKLEECRASFASSLNVEPATIYFTSGATESIQIVLASLLLAKVPGKVIMSAIEHEAVLSWSSILKEKGWKIITLKAKNGFVDPEELKANIDSEVRLIAVQLVNNVIGSIQPIESLVSVTREKEREYNRPIFFFCDSVQGLGKISFSLTDLDVDGASFSAHKIKGPRGIGALYLKKPLQVIAKAGGQERGVRGGTENLPSIAGFTKALSLYLAEDKTNIININTQLRAFFKEKNIKVLSPEKNCSPYILSLSTKLPSEVLTRMLSDEGYCVSAGSACSNNAKGKAENVIKAMGFSDSIAQGTIRLSFSVKTSEEEALKLALLIYLKTKDF